MDPLDSDRSKRGRTRAALATAALLAAIVAGSIVIRSVRSDRATEPAPSSVIQGYVAAFNEGDVDAMMTHFAADAQLLDHPFAEKAVGAAAIRDVQVSDLANAAPTAAIRLFGLEVAGDVVTWNQVYENRLGEFWCATGNRAIVVEDQIVRWEFSRDRRRCPWSRDWASPRSPHHLRGTTGLASSSGRPSKLPVPPDWRSERRRSRCDVRVGHAPELGHRQPTGCR